MSNTEEQPRYINFHFFQVKKTALNYIIITFLFLFCLLILFRVMFVNFIDNYQIGYRYDTFGEHQGEIRKIDNNGYIVTWPFKTKVHTIDGRPLQACISSNNRVLNCKLVKFNPAGLDLFLEWHGRQTYVVNTSSTTNTDSDNSLTAILKAYAYEESGKVYPFMTIIRELSPTEVSDILPGADG